MLGISERVFEKSGCILAIYINGNKLCSTKYTLLWISATEIKFIHGHWINDVAFLCLVCAIIINNIEDSIFAGISNRLKKQKKFRSPGFLSGLTFGGSNTWIVLTAFLCFTLMKAICLGRGWRVSASNTLHCSKQICLSPLLLALV